MNPLRALVSSCVLAVFLVTPTVAAAQNAQVIGSIRDQSAPSSRAPP